MRKLILTIFIYLLFFAGLSNSAYSQFIHFQMKIESELSADVIQDLDFGTVITNTGTTRIRKGDTNMGIFRVRALNVQQLLVTLTPPPYLISPDTDDRIPISLEASYTNDRTHDVQQAVSFNNNSAWLTIGETQGNTPQSSEWETAYIYVYGSLIIGDVNEGTYTGSLVLNVEYQ